MSETGPSSSRQDAIGTSPSRISSPELRFEAQRAFVWVSIVGLVALGVYISQSLLVIFGAMVAATIIDGGTRLLGRILPIGRSWRVAIVLGLAVGFLYWLVTYAGSQISREAAAFPALIQSQIAALFRWLQDQGFAVEFGNIQSIATSLISGVGTVTRALGGILGGITTLVLIAIIGIYVALEPQLYERGVAWILPRHRRTEFFKTASKMGYTMRRLMAGRLIGMIVEGVFTYIMLAWVGPLVGIGAVPMAALLAILTGLLAFIPNLGALVSGVLLGLVGFSGGVDMGLYTIFVYILVQNFDGYFVIPMIARKTVDLAPALVLGFQLIMGILFGILGLFLADPLLAMAKVALEQRAQRNEDQDKLETAQDGA